VTTLLTIGLDPAEAARKAALSVALKAAITLYNSEVEEVNELLRAAAERADAARQKINAVLAEVNTFATVVHGKIEEFVSERDTAWLASDYSSAVERWQTAWENIDTGAVPGPGRLEIETVDAENEGILDKIGDAPASP